MQAHRGSHMHTGTAKPAQRSGRAGACAETRVRATFADAQEQGDRHRDKRACDIGTMRQARAQMHRHAHIYIHVCA